MTNESRTHDSIDTEQTNGRDAAESQAPDSLSRRTFLQGAAASATSLAGLGVLGGSADAASRKRLVVVSQGSGRQTYEIEMAQGAHISKGRNANPNDTITTQGGTQRVEGQIWNSNKDTYTYTGEINYVEGDGQLSFRFPGGAFSSGEDIRVQGRGSGRHTYSIGTDSGDIDLNSDTEYVDSDDGGWFSEYSFNSDSVSGAVRNRNHDSYHLTSGQVNEVTSNGQIRFSPTSQFDKGEAVVYFFYMGDSRFRTTFQEMTNINKALKGYDKKLLLKHQHGVQGIHSAPAQANADKMVKPTRRNLIHCLKNLTQAGYTIDLYIQSHGTDDRGTAGGGAFKTSKGSHGTADWFTDQDIRALKSTVGSPVPLRMVYQMNCWGSNLNSAWTDAGAKAVLGSRYVNFYPHEIMQFADAWRNGHKFHDALGQSRNSRGVVNQGLAAHADATEDEWSSHGGCSFWSSILGNSRCAKEYFVNYWGHDPSSWKNFPTRLNGKANIEHASEKLIAGDGSLTNQSYY